MSNLSYTIKTALENTVLCRGAHSAKESYEYAAKMEKMIKDLIKKEADDIIELINDGKIVSATTRLESLV
jgi:hypothetical protein